jgi:hypothetical protein
MRSWCTVSIEEVMDQSRVRRDLRPAQVVRGLEDETSTVRSGA